MLFAESREQLLSGISWQVKGGGGLHGYQAVWRGPGQTSQRNLGTGAGAARVGTSGTAKGTLPEG